MTAGRSPGAVFSSISAEESKAPWDKAKCRSFMVREPALTSSLIASFARWQSTVELFRQAEQTIEQYSCRELVSFHSRLSQLWSIWREMAPPSSFIKAFHPMFRDLEILISGKIACGSFFPNSDLRRSMIAVCRERR